MKLNTLLFTALLTAGVLHADEAAISKKLAKIPAPAAEALKKAAGSATIEKLSIEKDGKVTIYELDLREEGKPNREVSVTADGKLHAEEETLALADVPDAPRKAIEEGAKGAKVERVNRIKRVDAPLTYEALYVNKGKKTEVEFYEDGKQKPEEK